MPRRMPFCTLWASSRLFRSLILASWLIVYPAASFAQSAPAWIGADPNEPGSPLHEDTLDDLVIAITGLPREQRVAAALDLIERVAHRLTLPGISDGMGVGDGFLFGNLNDGVYDPELYVPVLAALQAKAAGFAARGNANAELFFLDWQLLGYPPEERLAHLRRVHRRAAELNALDNRVARSVRFAIGLYVRALNDEGHADEALIAMSQTFAELDAKGMRLSDPALLRIFGETLTLNGRHDEADAVFAEQLGYWQTRAEAAPSDAFRQTQLTNNQMSYYRNIMGRFADAEEPGRIAAEMAIPLFGRESGATQRARYNYATALLGQGKAAEALPFYEEALPLQLRDENDAFVGRNTDTIILLTTLARARAQVPGNEGAALAAARDAADRLRARRNEQLAGGRKASQEDAAVSALAKAVARSARRNPLSSAYDMVLYAGWAARNIEPAALTAAFSAAQDLVLSDAGDAITQAAARSLAGDGPLGDLVRQRQDTANKIVAGVEAFRTAQYDAEPEELARRRANQTALGERLAELDAILARDFPEYAELTAPNSVEIGKVRSTLGKDEALLFLLPSEGSHFVFAVTRNKAEWHKVPDGAEAVARLVGRLKCRLDEMTCNADESFSILQEEDQGEANPIDDFYPRYDVAAAHELYRVLLAPVEKALRNKKTVYVVATGAISALPLATLVTAPVASAADADGLKKVPWLGNRHAFVTLPSVSALSLTRRSASSAGKQFFVGYGAPSLDGDPSQAETRGGGSRRRRGTAPLRAAGFFKGDPKTGMRVDPALLRKMDPLPGTARELDSLASALGRESSAVHTGDAATEGAVKRDTALTGANVLVFATHGLLPGEMGQSAEPGLVLTPPSSGDAIDDGLLTASEAAALNLRAKWVILSACNTATADSAPGSDALSGLARSFLYAGAQSLLASHWRVSDDASATLTLQTIQTGNRGVRQAQALQSAQRAVRSGVDPAGKAIAEWKPHWAHPSAWAPFTLIADRNR